MWTTTSLKMVGDSLKFRIHAALAAHDFITAKFLAELQMTANDCDATRALLARCLLAENSLLQVVHLLRLSQSNECRYLLALAQYALT